MSQHNETGQRGERIALKLAQRLGWPEGQTNVPIAGAEADVVCTRTLAGKREALIVEVKTRLGELPEVERVSPRQLAKLRRMADALADAENLDRVELAVVLVGLQGQAQTTRWLDVAAF